MSNVPFKSGNFSSILRRKFVTSDVVETNLQLVKGRYGVGVRFPLSRCHRRCRCRRRSLFEGGQQKVLSLKSATTKAGRGC
jgi:hypothetical protein